LGRALESGSRRQLNHADTPQKIEEEKKKKKEKRKKKRKNRKNARLLVLQVGRRCV
jgi:hypothetical protein